MAGENRLTIKTRMLATMATAVVASIVLVAAAPAGSEEPAPEDPPVAGEPPDDEIVPQPARLRVKVKGLRGGKRPALRPAVALGRVAPFVPNQRVRVRFHRGGKVVRAKRVAVRRVAGKNAGRFKLRSPRLGTPGRYTVRAWKPPTRAQAGAKAKKAFGLRFPALKQGNRGRAVALLNRLLRKQGYHAPKGKRFGAATADAVLAFRKVNRMGSKRRAAPQVLGRLALGKGAFKLRHPGAGRHVEVDLKRQVMVLAKGGKAQHTFHISSGKRSTPSDRGRFRFHRREPGYNSLGMLDSVYYNRGEAIHGYRSVPSYPASNGCIRVPNRDARFVYGWVRLGMPIYVY